MLLLVQELLEEVELDDEDEEKKRKKKRFFGPITGGRGRRPLPHSNSLQNLKAAGAETAPKHTRHHPRHHAPVPSNVSARAIHGGSLPSGVDTCTYFYFEDTEVLEIVTPSLILEVLLHDYDCCF